MNEHTLLTENQTAERLNIKRATLTVWRCRKKGPPYIRIEGAIRYPKDELEAWISSRRVSHEAL